MKTLKYIMAAALLVAAFAATEVSAKKKMVPRAYIFGFSASFTDSVVYMTNVQAVDSVWIDTKTKFLLGRENYSYQLRDYFTYKQNMPNRTCLVLFGLNRKDAEKKYVKMKRKYTEKADGKYDVRYLDSADFKFRPVSIDEEEYQENPPQVTNEQHKNKKRDGHGKHSRR